MRSAISALASLIVRKRTIAIVLALPCIALAGIVTAEYFSWRNMMIKSDVGSINRMCGGETEEDRLLDIKFISPISNWRSRLKPWEYKVLKKASDGTRVWMHWKLTKRMCGNWMLMDQSGNWMFVDHSGNWVLIDQSGWRVVDNTWLVRPIELRYPNGVPHRPSYSCLGFPLSSE